MRSSAIDVDFFPPPPEVESPPPGDLRRVDRKFVQFLNGQIDDRRATKVSPQESSFSSLVSALLNQLLITSVCRRQCAEKALWIDTSRFSKKLSFHKDRTTAVKLLTISPRTLRFVINGT